MEELLLKFAAQSPSLAILALITWWFLRALREKDAAFVAAMDRLDASAAERTAACHDIHLKSIEAITRNSLVMEAARTTIAKAEHDAELRDIERERGPGR